MRVCVRARACMRTCMCSVRHSNTIDDIVFNATKSKTIHFSTMNIGGLMAC